MKNRHHKKHKPLYSKVEELQNFIVKSLIKKEAVITGKIVYNYLWGNGMFFDNNSCFSEDISIYVEKEYLDLRSIKFQEYKFCQIITLDIKALRTCSIRGVKFLDDINKVMSDCFIELQERSWETEMYVEALEGYYFICNQSFDKLEIPKELLKEFEEIKSCIFQGC